MDGTLISVTRPSDAQKLLEGGWVHLDLPVEESKNLVNLILGSEDWDAKFGLLNNWFLHKAVSRSAKGRYLSAKQAAVLLEELIRSASEESRRGNYRAAEKILGHRATDVSHIRDGLTEAQVSRLKRIRKRGKEIYEVASSPYY